MSGGDDWQRQFDRALGANIRRARQLQRITQRALASRAGTNAPSLCQWEDGRRISVRTAARIALALGVSLESLLDGEPRLLLERALAAAAGGGARA